MEYVKTFSINECKKISLRSYKKISDSRDGIIPPITAEINDEKKIATILSLLKKIEEEIRRYYKFGE